MQPKRRSPAGCFLKIVAALIIIVLIGAVLYRVFERQLMELAFVPSAEFQDVPMPPGANYAQASLWIARPDIAGNPALWAPQGFAPTGSPRASVFFVHPTSFLERNAWNAPLTHEDSQTRAVLFVRSQASAFNGIGA